MLMTKMITMMKEMVMVMMMMMMTMMMMMISFVMVKTSLIAMMLMGRSGKGFCVGTFSPRPFFAKQNSPNLSQPSKSSAPTAFSPSLATPALLPGFTGGGGG